MTGGCTYPGKPGQVVIRLEPLEAHHLPPRVGPHHSDEDGETQKDEAVPLVAVLGHRPGEDFEVSSAAPGPSAAAHVLVSDQPRPRHQHDDCLMAAALSKDGSQVSVAMAGKFCISWRSGVEQVPSGVEPTRESKNVDGRNGRSMSSKKGWA